MYLDLPGTYSLEATSPDEAITRDVVQGKIAEEGRTRCHSYVWWMRPT